MSNTISINKPGLLHINDNTHTYYGGNQIWYSDRRQKLSGCGPTTASHLFWYVARTHSKYEGLAKQAESTRENFVELMEDVWKYVTPGFMGVNNTIIFSDGVVEYAKVKGSALSCDIIDIPALPFNRPSFDKLSDFLINAFSKDLPVAFLNLSNGSLQNLESWHWVTLISFDPVKGTARMYDQGLRKDIDLKLWLRTTLQGGGFVTLSI